MKEFETKPVTREHTFTKFTRCDLCGWVVKGDEWSQHSNEVAETQISLKEGRQNPEFGDGDEYCFDVCPECFKSKLIPWFASHGAQPRKTHWEF